MGRIFQFRTGTVGVLCAENAGSLCIVNVTKIIFRIFKFFLL